MPHPAPPAPALDASALPSLAALEARRVEALRRALRIGTVSDLEHACRTNRVRDLPGFGREIQAALLREIPASPAWGPSRLLDARRGAAGRALGRLQREFSAIRLGLADATRRMAPLGEEVHLLATAHDPAALLDAFRSMPTVARVVSSEADRARVVLDDGVPVTLEVAPDDSTYFVREVLRTGSPAFVEALAGRARERGFVLDERGLRRGEERVAVGSEQEVFDRLEVPWRPAEDREGSDLDAPSPSGLLAMRDARGCLGVHTSRAAGSYVLTDMADRAAREGYGWVGVCDRSPTSFPRGIGAHDVVTQREECRAASKAPEGAPPFDVVHGTEVRILPDGSLDWPDDALRDFDAVVAALDECEEDAGDGALDPTARLIRAARHPLVNVLAHPSGRILLGRPGPAVDVAAVLEACAETGTAVGISGDPHRLDLPEEWHAEARRRGVRAALLADAHDLLSVDQVILAVGAARRGGWRAEEVVTTMEAEAFRTWCREKPARRRD